MTTTTNITATTSFEELAERYLATWNESDPTTRRQLVEQLWESDGRYVDPLVAATGHEAIDATLAAVQAQFAGLEFRLAGTVDAHHDQARFTWELAPAGGAAVAVGFDVLERGADGRIALVLGFLDQVPAA